MVMIDKKLLEILACSARKGDIEPEGNKLVCKKCHRVYPIRDGIPVMLIEEAELEEQNKSVSPRDCPKSQKRR
jgi:hypothetical protein